MLHAVRTPPKEEGKGGEEEEGRIERRRRDGGEEGGRRGRLGERPREADPNKREVVEGENARRAEAMEEEEGARGEQHKRDTVSALHAHLPYIPEHVLARLYDAAGGDPATIMGMLQHFLKDDAEGMAEAPDWDGALDGRPATVAAVYGRQESRCGYCNEPGDGKGSYGMDLRVLRVEDYKALIDRGWRRSGSYTYLPDNVGTCCPQYAIRLPVAEARLSKRHRQVLRRFRRYLATGEASGAPAAAAAAAPAAAPPAELARALGGVLGGEANVVVARHRRVAGAFSSAAAVRAAGRDGAAELAARAVEAMPAEVAGYRPAAEGPGYVNFYPVSAPAAAPAAPAAAEPAGVPVFAGEGENLGDRAAWRHSYETELVPAAFEQEAFELYRRYQVAVHGDKEEELSEEGYTRFLCTDPFVSADPFYGAFHMLHRIDGRLVAVGVVDVLPGALSSVYLFYDPAVAFLSPGVLTALLELQWLRHTAAARPEMTHYYLGFYIHSCPKMRYKAQFAPSQLLCPVRYSWHDLAACAPALDAARYAVFSDAAAPPAAPALDPLDAACPLAADGDAAAFWEAECGEALAGAPVVLRRKMYTFGSLAERVRARLGPPLAEYARMVGPSLVRRLVINLD